MITVAVTAGEHSYPIHIGEYLHHRLPELLMRKGLDTSRKLFLVSDSEVAPLYLNSLRQHLQQEGFHVGVNVVPAGESSKSLHVWEQLLSCFIEFGLDRQSVVLALGGGMVGDLAGFAAASYMRGISFVQLPTTILAHDSSVGGKVGVNHAQGKNLIGAFHQPEMVVYDTVTLHSLPQRQVRSGYAEVLKHAFIWDASFYEWLHTHTHALIQMETAPLQEALFRGCSVKAEIVASDEREQNVRAILNYGHTIGHAVESYSHYNLTHGEAVAIGMVGAAMLAEELAVGESIVAETEALLRAFSLPIRIPGEWELDALLSLLKHDKKRKHDKYVFILPRSIGQVEIREGISEEAVMATLKRLQYTS
ncbi:3-dehydroquinate synthase [Mechercharimyces sp. CAU 1602]|uniref:3-dehydroquinate synthase n=1 Tax=Mechercharimyces sp. CAU 1602 TaxID=2973933 RepID=UPI0021629D89|nr:3-dehydroquinate synthase [Mechercharimyces sp. CAU 1602]MCS1350994.1 3-dehydroquinate synthase [Mechercharimyces sp. CAU 1602]